MKNRAVGCQCDSCRIPWQSETCYIFWGVILAEHFLANQVVFVIGEPCCDLGLPLLSPNYKLIPKKDTTAALMRAILQQKNNQTKLCTMYKRIASWHRRPRGPLDAVGAKESVLLIFTYPTINVVDSKLSKEWGSLVLHTTNSSEYKHHPRRIINNILCIPLVKNDLFISTHVLDIIIGAHRYPIFWHNCL